MSHSVKNQLEEREGEGKGKDRERRRASIFTATRERRRKDGYKGGGSGGRRMVQGLEKKWRLVPAVVTGQWLVGGVS